MKGVDAPHDRWTACRHPSRPTITRNSQPYPPPILAHYWVIVGVGSQFTVRGGFLSCQDRVAELGDPRAISPASPHLIAALAPVSADLCMPRMATWSEALESGGEV